MLRLTREGNTPDIQGARVLQGLGAIGHRAAGGYNIVYEDVAASLYTVRAFEGVGDVTMAGDGGLHAHLRGRISGAAQGSSVHWDAGELPEFASDKLGLVEAAAALSPGMERHGAEGIDRIWVALQIFGEQARNVRRGDAYAAVLEVVNDAAGAATKLVGRSHTVECGCSAPARIAELWNARAGAEEAIRTVERRHVELTVGAEVATLALADYAILRQ